MLIRMALGDIPTSVALRPLALDYSHDLCHAGPGDRQNGPIDRGATRPPYPSWVGGLCPAPPELAG
jgi:hypothetical protein